MQSVLIVIHLMIVITLVAVVLLQRSEGGALGMGGGGGFMTGRGQANALTRATAILAALFFATSIGLTMLARMNQAPEVIFQSVTPIGPSGPVKEGEGKENLLDQLQRLEDQNSKLPTLPPGASLPGQNGAAAPQPGQSVLETGQAAPQGLNLLPLPQSAAPQPGQSVLQAGPEKPEGLNLPPLPQPAVPSPQAVTTPVAPAKVDPEPAASPATHRHPAKARAREHSK